MRKLIAAGTGMVAMALSTLPVHACGCGRCIGAGLSLAGFGWPAVSCQFAPLTSLYGLGMMLPSWGCGWGWW